MPLQVPHHPLTCATRSPCFSCSTGYGCSRPWFKHSTKPKRIWPSDSSCFASPSAPSARALQQQHTQIAHVHVGKYHSTAALAPARYRLSIETTHSHNICTKSTHIKCKQQSNSQPHLTCFTVFSVNMVEAANLSIAVPTHKLRQLQLALANSWRRGCWANPLKTVVVFALVYEAPGSLQGRHTCTRMCRHTHWVYGAHTPDCEGHCWGLLINFCEHRA